MNENEELKSAYNYGRDSGYTNGFVDGYRQGVKDAEPEKGYWILEPNEDENKVAFPNLLERTFKCSRCGCRYTWPYTMRYCGDCGTKMEYVQDGNDRKEILDRKDFEEEWGEADADE